MLLRFIWVGKTRNESLRSLVDDYLNRLARFDRCEVAEVRETDLKTPREGIEDEARRILNALKSGGVTVLLDVGGIELSSQEVASQVERWRDSGVKEVAFVIGGHNGVSKSVEARVDIKWSLSRMTFTHEMARVVILEQIYRAFTIIKGLPYQK